ncbi:hypothetical protein D3C80_1827660 [compost metagenome]
MRNGGDPVIGPTLVQAEKNSGTESIPGPNRADDIFYRNRKRVCRDWRTTPLKPYGHLGRVNDGATLNTVSDKTISSPVDCIDQ